MQRYESIPQSLSMHSPVHMSMHALRLKHKLEEQQRNDIQMRTRMEMGRKRNAHVTMGGNSMPQYQVQQQRQQQPIHPIHTRNSHQMITQHASEQQQNMHMNMNMQTNVRTTRMDADEDVNSMSNMGTNMMRTSARSNTNVGGNVHSNKYIPWNAAGMGRGMGMGMGMGVESSMSPWVQPHLNQEQQSWTDARNMY